MITVSNYTTEAKTLIANIQGAPPEIQEGHKFFMEYGDLYNDDKEIKEAIDLYIARVNKGVILSKKNEPKSSGYRKYKKKKASGGKPAPKAKDKAAAEKKEKPHKQYDRGRYEAIFGDYDKDGIANVDDPNPLTPGDTDSVEEVQLSDEIAALIDFRKEYETVREGFVGKLGESVGADNATILSRTKTPYSIINKLRRKRLVGKNGITDVVGAMIVFDTQKELNEFKDYVNTGALGEVLVFDDYYTNPLNGYKAYHWNIIYDGAAIELQAKTARMKTIASANHTLYKTGRNDADRLLELTNLMEKADNGDHDAAEQIDAIISDQGGLEKYLSAAEPEPSRAAKPDPEPSKTPEPVKVDQNTYFSAVNNAIARIDQSMTEDEVIELGREIMAERRAYVQAKDLGRDSKQRLTPTPENLIRWMKRPGQFDLIGVDTFKQDTPTADYKREISKQKLFRLFKIEK